MENLAAPNEPFTLNDGTQINPATGATIRQQVEIPSNSTAVKQVTNFNKRIADLPALPKQMNVINIILSYHLFGMNDSEISLATELSIEQITRIKMSDTFTTMHVALISSIQDETKSTVRDIISSQSINAASTITDLMQSDDDKVALTAAKDILDRDGHRPADIVEHRVKLEGGLNIIHIKKDQSEKLPDIEIAKEEF